MTITFVDLDDVSKELDSLARSLVDQADESSAECHPLRTLLLSEALCESLVRQIRAEGMGPAVRSVEMITQKLNRCFSEIEMEMAASSHRKGSS